MMGHADGRPTLQQAQEYLPLRINRRRLISDQTQDDNGRFVARNPTLLPVAGQQLPCDSVRFPAAKTNRHSRSTRRSVPAVPGKQVH
jgi:hypothetical protein